MQKCISSDRQALDLPVDLQGINSAVKHSEFSPSICALHEENKILFVYEISSQ